jgi:hypothetical protein
VNRYILVLFVIFVLLNVTSCGKAKAGGTITTQTFIGSQGQSCYAMVDGDGHPFAGGCQ